MGQRSQIYVRFESVGNNAVPILIANYYQWNYGERMISRIKHIVEYITSTFKEVGYDKTGNFHFWYEREETQLKIRRLLDVNFDMQDIVLSQDIIEEYRNYGDGYKFNDYVFYDQDNNDGQAYLYVMNDGTVKYAFTDYKRTEILTPEQYMKGYAEHLQENDPDAWKLCKENMKYIREHAQLMTNAEWAWFLDDDYSALYKEKSTPAQRAEFNMSILWGEYRKSKKSYKGILYKDILANYSDDKAASIIRNHAYLAKGVPSIGTEKDFVNNILNSVIDEMFEIDVPKEVKIDSGYYGKHGLFTSNITSKEDGAVVELYNKLLKNVPISSINKLSISDENECKATLGVNNSGEVIVQLKLKSEKFGKNNKRYVTVELKPYEKRCYMNLVSEYAEKYLGGAIFKKAF